MGITYQHDILAWANEQAAFLRAGRFDLLDIDHLADEIEDVGKSEQRELVSRMAVLLAHLLKWQFQPERRSASWRATIREQRKAVKRRLERTPSLARALTDPDWLEDAWLDARSQAAHETGISFDQFPDSLPWPIESVLYLEGWPFE